MPTQESTRKTAQPKHSEEARKKASARVAHAIEHRQPVTIEVSSEFYSFALRWDTTPAAIITDYVQRIIDVDLTTKKAPKHIH